MRRWRSMFAVLAVVSGVGAVAPIAPVASGAAGHPPIIRVRQGTSTNWSGYAAFGGPGSFSSASGTWTQPAVSCTSQNTYSSYWVGLDGYNTSTVEQIGTEADCSNGAPRYYAWYEMYPRPSYFAAVTVTPSHTYRASVTGSRGSYTLTLVDVTTSQSFTTTQKLSQAKGASAEVIVEAPWSGSVLPLANYGSVGFSGSKANGVGIGTFASLDPITMQNPYGMKSTPSGFTDTAKQNFSVTWSAS